jgi:hypothetical protein
MLFAQECKPDPHGTQRDPLVTRLDPFGTKRDPFGTKRDPQRSKLHPHGSKPSIFAGSSWLAACRMFPEVIRPAPNDSMSSGSEAHPDTIERILAVLQ